MVEGHRGEKSEKRFKWPGYHPNKKETKNDGNLVILKEDIFELSTGQVARQT
jgi:hypothetical protein